MGIIDKIQNFAVIGIIAGGLYLVYKYMTESGKDEFGCGNSSYWCSHKNACIPLTDSCCTVNPQTCENSGMILDEDLCTCVTNQDLECGGINALENAKRLATRIDNGQCWTPGDMEWAKRCEPTLYNIWLGSSSQLCGVYPEIVPPVPPTSVKTGCGAEIPEGSGCYPYAEGIAYDENGEVCGKNCNVRCSDEYGNYKPCDGSGPFNEFIDPYRCTPGVPVDSTGYYPDIFGNLMKDCIEVCHRGDSTCAHNLPIEAGNWRFIYD